jgi:hypothetical protein
MGPVAYGTRIGLLQVLGYALVFVGSIPAALAMLKERKDKNYANKDAVAN